MKIAIFGGAFNPVHLGHVEIVKQLTEIYDFDKVLIIPTKISPHKSNLELVDENHRLNMCKLAFEGIKNCEVSTIELDKNSVSYTYQTLQILKEKYKDDDLYLVCGSDMYLSLLDWKKTEIIFKLSNIIGFIRENESIDTMNKYRKKLEEYGAKSSICKVFIPPFSSTQVRTMIKQGSDITKLLSNDVANYIKTHKLYL